jgi:hypothetical protein
MMDPRGENASGIPSRHRSLGLTAAAVIAIVLSSLTTPAQAATFSAQAAATGGPSAPSADAADVPSAREDGLAAWSPGTNH